MITKIRIDGSGADPNTLRTELEDAAEKFVRAGLGEVAVVHTELDLDELDSRHRYIGHAVVVVSAR